MRRLIVAAVAAALLVAAAPVGAVAAPSHGVAAAAATAHGAAAPAPTLSAQQQQYLALAQAGVASAKRRWRDRRLGWFDSRLGDRDRYPLATIWDIVPLFQALDAIAIAQPSPANLDAVNSFAHGAERYLNRGLRPVPGYSPYPGDRTRTTETWFDDNGWWGIAFMNAYRATGSRRYLADGIWWNTTHPYKAGAALAADTLLATLIYEQTRSPFALAQAQRFLAWGNGPGFSTVNGLYAGSSINPDPADYIEAPLIYAQALLCRLTGTAEYCTRADQLKEVALRRFGYLLDFSPQYDAIYVQWMLALYALEGDRTLYTLATDNARGAQARALDTRGLYLLSWNGEALPRRNARPGMLQTHAATTSLFAWLAVYAPPG
jgi:hypothetical protein